MLVLDTDTRIAGFNPAAQKLLHLASGDVGQRIGDGRLGEDFPDLQEAIGNALRDPAERRLEIRDRNGSPYSLYIQPKWTHGSGMAGSLILFIDDDRRRTERHERDAYLSTAVLDAARDLLVVFLDGEGRITRFNDACERLTGYSQKEVAGKHVWDFLLIPEELDAVKATFDRILTGPSAVRFENYWVDKEGRRRLIAWSNSAIHHGDGSVDCVIATGIDITDVRLAREQARDSQAIVNALMETAAQSILAVAADGRIVLCNKTAESMFGYSRSQLLARFVEDLLPPDRRERHVKHRRDYFEHPRIRSMGVGLDLAARRKDGSEFPVEISLSNVEEAGRTLAVAFVSDITLRKKAQDALQASVEHFRALVENCHECIVLLDANNKVRYASDSIERMLGYKTFKWLGKKWLGDHMHADDQPTARERHGQCAVQRGAITEYTARIRHKQGGWREIECVSHNLLENAAVSGIIVNARDVTERKRAERELQRSEAAARESETKLKALTARLLEAQEEERRRVSRELHDDLMQKLGMLAAEIGGLTENLPASPDQIHRKLESIATRVSAITDDVRRTAYQLHPSVLEHVGLIAALEALCADLWSQTGLRVTFHHRNAPQDLAPEIAVGLYRIAQECLRNTITHSGSAKAALHLQGTPDEIRLTVSDQGCGFERSDQDGPHLGLISMEERTRAMDGQFSINSRPGRGTRVEVRVPWPRQARSVGGGASGGESMLGPKR